MSKRLSIAKQIHETERIYTLYRLELQKDQLDELKELESYNKISYIGCSAKEKKRHFKKMKNNLFRMKIDHKNDVDELEHNYNAEMDSFKNSVQALFF